MTDEDDPRARASDGSRTAAGRPADAVDAAPEAVLETQGAATRHIDEAQAASSRDAGPSGEQQRSGPRAPAGASTAAARADREAGVDEEHPFGHPGRPLDRRSPFFVGFTGALGVALAYLAYQAFVSAQSALTLVLVSAFLAIGLNPSVTRLVRLGLSRGLAVAAVALTTLLVLAGILYLLVPPVVEQTTNAVEGLPGFLAGLQDNRLVSDLNERFNLLDRAQDAVSGSTAVNALGGVLGGLTLVLSSVFNVLIVIILTVYFLSSFERLQVGALRLVPASRRERAGRLGEEMLSRVGGYLAGAVIIAAIAGFTSLAFMLVTGIPFPFALALVVAILDLIPQIGATLGAVVVCIVAFFVSIPVFVAAVVFFVAYQQFENYVIYPKTMQRTVHVSDLAGVVSVLLGAALLGVLGALLAIPVCAAVQLLVREVFIPRQDTA